MKYIILIPAVIAIIISTSCNNDISNDTDKGINNSAFNLQNPNISAPINTTDDSNTLINPSQINPQQNILAGNGLNPEHGKPGHRCDIPVGSPLNSQPNQPVINNQPVISTTTNQPINPVPVVSTANGLNPEHGKPGHRCDIAVGAPLNGKPAQPASTNQPVVSTTTPEPLTSNSTILLPDDSSATALNPQHGKPGHRCDIAIGAPLNSKPKQPDNQ